MARIGLTLSLPDLTGAARMLFYFARALKSNGHEVLVLHGPPPPGDGPSILDELQAIGIETQLVPILRRPIPPFVYRATKQAAASCDVIIGVNQRDRSVAVKTANLLGVPAVLSVQNQHNFWGPLFVPQLKRFYYARSLRRFANLSICTSDAVRDQLLEMDIPAERCVVLHNGIEIGEPPPSDVRQRVRSELGLSEESRVFINVGRLDVQKAQDLLLRAWAAVDRPEHAHLLLVGDITDGNQYERSARFKADLLEFNRESGIAGSTSFLGWRDDVGDLLAASDVYVHAARWEGWPLTVVEAMAAELPFIMTDCSGLPIEFDASRHGAVVETENVAALSSALASYMEMGSDELTQRGKQCRALAEEHYDISVVGRKFAEHVEQALERGPSIGARSSP